ncbi:MAG TPA: sigma-70 family RNA polymerase sigma factor [Tepidisphaeraceae bacterium]|nr:sigma-70 family RNA polymerase sigma factor [Tepidisphaeraceae bacterium]
MSATPLLDARMDELSTNVNVASGDPPAAAPAPDADDVLMQRIARRDAHALEILYDRYSGAVYSLCHRILRDGPSAEDVLVDVFWELWDKCDRYDPGRGSAITYLTLIARSRALDYRRSKQGPAAARRAGASEVAAAESEGALERARDRPFEQAVLAERRQQVLRAVNALTPEQRRAVELAYFDGFSHSEIAERLDKPLGTVKTWIRQGLIHLRRSLRNA